VSSFTQQVSAHYTANRLIEEAQVAGTTVSPLADGFCVISHCWEYTHDQAVQIFELCLSMGRCIVIDRNDIAAQSARRTISETWQDNIYFINTGGEEFHYGEMSNVAFIMPRNLIEKQTNASPVLISDFRRNPNLPNQEVTFVGIGSTIDMLTDSAHKLIMDSSDLILFHRTYEHIVREINPTCNLYILPYIYSDFDRNIVMVDSQLRTLQYLGVCQVTVLIEGNPQIYDIPEKLSRDGRSFKYSETTPIGILIAEKIEREVEASFMQPGHIYLSALAHRHGRGESDLPSEVASYAKANVTCVLVEMYSAEISPIIESIRKRGTNSIVFLASNAFSDNQRIIFLDAGDLESRTSALDELKGDLTTLIIVPSRCIMRDSHSYRLAQSIYQARGSL
jgi:hypothetical protein